MIDVTLTRPWLDLDLGTEMPVISWAVHRPGLTRARHISWRGVRNADLPPERDAVAWLAGEMAATGREAAVGMITSRDVGFYRQAEARAGMAEAICVATVGLSNAERIGQRCPREATGWGTINLAVRLSTGLTGPALIEAMSIAVEARTAAVIDAGPDLPEGRATGTGTDCIAVAAPDGPTAYAGLHTDAGEALGRAVYGAVRAGVEDWCAGLGREAAE